MKTLNRSLLSVPEQRRLDLARSSPVTVLQIGEGHFLRGFFDWMIHTCRGKGLFPGSVALTQSRPTGVAKIKKLEAQDGLYTLVIRGVENGKPVERREIVSVFAQIFDPYEDWNRMADLAVSEDLRFVVSNTTEALTLQPTRPIHSALSLALDETKRLTHLSPDSLMELDVAAHRADVNALLLRTSELVRDEARRQQKVPPVRQKILCRGVDLIGANLRGATSPRVSFSLKPSSTQQRAMRHKVAAVTRSPDALVHFRQATVTRSACKALHCRALPATLVDGALPDSQTGRTHRRPRSTVRPAHVD